MTLHRDLKGTVDKHLAVWTGMAERARAAIAAEEAAGADPEKPAPMELTPKAMRRIWYEAGGTKQTAYRARKRAEMSEEEFTSRLAKRYPQR